MLATLLVVGLSMAAWVLHSEGKVPIHYVYTIRQLDVGYKVECAYTSTMYPYREAAVADMEHAITEIWLCRAK